MHQNAFLFRIINSTAMNEENLLVKIMARIQQEKKIMELRKRLIFFSFITIGSAITLAPAFNALRLELAQSGISQYLSLLFSDYSTVIILWQEFTLSVLETFPVMTVIVFLAAVFAFLVSLRFLARDLRSFSRLNVKLT